MLSDHFLCTCWVFPSDLFYFILFFLKREDEEKTLMLMLPIWESNCLKQTWLPPTKDAASAPLQASHTDTHVALSHSISFYRNVGSCLYDGTVRNVICMWTEMIQWRLILSDFSQRWKETWGFITLFERTAACSSGERWERKGPDILQRYTKLQDCCVLSWKRIIPRQHLPQL